MQNISNAEFLAEIEEFIRCHNLSPTAFGKEVMGDPNFIFDLRDGRSPSLNVVKQVAAFINGYAG